MIMKLMVAIMPAILVVFSLNICIFWARSDMIYTDNLPWWFFWIAMPLLIGIISAFFSNLLAPIATERKTAIRIGILSFCVYIMFYLIHYIFEYIQNSYNWYNLEFIGFTTIGLFIVIIPAGILLMVGVAIAGWLGARVRMAITPRPSLE
jgi:hypothetical protein